VVVDRGAANRPYNKKETAMHIGFLGLGNMGGPMAHNLLKAGHQVCVFDLSAAAVSNLVDAGAKEATSPAAVAQAGVEVIITMLPAAAHVKQVYLGEDGLLAHVPADVLLIDSSTIDPMSAREVAAAAAKNGNPMLDAPVSGGTVGAAAGTLTFMVGGNEADFQKAQPILATMGKNIVHCGGSGNGQVAKVANNLLLGISMIGAAEAMSLGVSLGMDPKVLASVINSSSGRCWSSEIYNPFPGVVENSPASRGYSGGFGTDLMLKDLGLASEAAKQVRQPVILGALAQQLYQAFSTQGNGTLDFSAIIKLYRQED
jgi:3-hydroxyisobutyrate dehydrogenase